MVLAEYALGSASFVYVTFPLTVCFNRIRICTSDDSAPGPKGDHKGIRYLERGQELGLWRLRPQAHHQIHGSSQLRIRVLFDALADHLARRHRRVMGPGDLTREEPGLGQ